jgi:ribonuclease E
MIDPSQADDDWAQLARELERDIPPPSAEAPVTAQADEFADAVHAEEFEELESAADGEAEAVPADGAVVAGEESPGTGRKRRRRRRRRRKGAVESAADEGIEEPDLEEEEPVEAVEEAAAEEEDEGEFDEGVPRDEEEEAEDAGGELLRELIATWNVPSWDEIVSGLHRPDR